MNQNGAIADQQTVQVLRYLMRMGKLTEVRMDTLLEALDLSSSRLLALQKLDQADEPLSLSQLASCMAFVKSNATQLIDHLEEDQLVKRVPDPDDRRCTLLEVTAEGKRRHLDALQAVQPLIDKLQDLYTPDERDQLLELLQRLEAGLN